MLKATNCWNAGQNVQGFRALSKEDEAYCVQDNDDV